LELSYTYKNKYTLTSSYSNSKDEVNETIEITNGMYYSRPANLGRQIVKSISFNGSFDPLKWLNINVYSELTNIAVKSDFYTGALNTSGTFSFSNANARITLGKGWDAELSGNYRKKLSPASTLKLSFNDIFYTSIRTGTINNLAQTEANWINRSDTRNAVLSYSYRFGKAFSSTPKRSESGANEEKNRVKN
jgi:hypothetical protein